MNEFREFGYAGFFMIFGILFVAGGLLANWILGANNPNRAKSMPYECGEIPIGSAWVQFHVGYYLIALVFVLFEVEAAFLFPLASVFKLQEEPWFFIAAISVFLFELLIGYAYAWKKGALEWL